MMGERGENHRIEAGFNMISAISKSMSTTTRWVSDIFLMRIEEKLVERGTGITRGAWVGTIEWK
jgi:hypothetical protein